MQENPSSPAKFKNLKLRPVSLHQEAWLQERGIDLEVVEVALLEEDTVVDCAVVARDTESGDTTLVAYVVLSGPFSPERLREHLCARLPKAMIPSAYVPVSALPLTRMGRIDERALCRLPVIDELLMRRWEQHLGSLPEVEQVAVVAEKKTQRPPPLHLDDLLPERTPAASAAGVVASPSDSTTEKENGHPTTMALAGGGQLAIPDDAPETLTEALLRSATEHAEKGITYVRADSSETFQSYATLLDRAKRILAGLQKRGLRPGDRAILQVDALEDHYPAFWACILGGFAPATVAVAPSYVERNGVVDKLFHSWELLGRPPILTSRHLVEPIAGLARLLPMDGLTIFPVDELENASPSDHIYHSQPDDLAFLQLTSGSTGVPKCIQEVHRSIVAHVHASQQFNGYTSDDITLNWMPVDHVVPILTFHLKDVYLGCQQVHAKTDLILADPLKWLDLLEAHSVNYTWSPNFGYKLLADQLATATNRSWNLSQMRFFMNAGEQVTLPVVRHFLDRVAPFGVSHRAMQPAFGMAEVCTCMTYQNHFDVRMGTHRFRKSSLEGRLQKTDGDDSTTTTFIDLGPPIPGVQIRITDHNNELLPEGVIGRLQIKGTVVTPGYLYNDAANKEAFVGDGWFNSGDLGFILDGRLTLTGREKEMIIVRGANFYCYEIEDVVNTVEGVEPTFAGACAVTDPATVTEGFAVFFVPKDDLAEDVIELVRAVRARVAMSLGVSPTYVIPLAIEDFPKTTSGKIQRGQLKQAFEAGQFRDALKALDVALENGNTLPNWFYRRAWRRREAPLKNPERSVGHTLMLLDRSGLGTSLAGWAYRNGQPWIEVEAGPAFEKLSWNRYRIAPGNPADYQHLLTTLAQEGIGVEEVVHLMSYGVDAGEISDLNALDAAQERGVYSLLFLLQAFADGHSSNQPVRLLVVSSHAQPVLPTDGVACEQGPLLGLVRTAPQEWPWLDCRHLDLQADDLEADAGAVLHELRAATVDQEVAYREGQRWVPRLEHIDLRREQAGSLPFERGGLYLVTGGLGGIASEIAAYLLNQHEARLLLVGRTPLPDEPEIGDTGVHSDAVTKRIAAYRELEQLGGEFLYSSADVADPVRLRAVVAEAETLWGRPLNGIIHLAGEFEERLLVEESRETFMASLRSKLQGTWVLHELAKDRPDCAFITFSSAIGLLGAFGAGAYAAANSFLDSFAHYRRRAGLPSACFAWSIWEAVGVARDYPLEKQKLSQARGLLSISSEQGLSSFLAGLHCDQAHLLVGLDATRPHVGQHLEQPAEETRALRAYFATRSEAVSATKLNVPEVRDRFGTPSTCELVRVSELPPTLASRIDRVRLAEEPSVPDAAHPGRHEGFAPPRTALERFLAGSWQDILRIDRVGVHDNFFEVGGDSIRGAMFLTQLQQALGEAVSMATIFERPTIAGLAVHLQEHYPDAIAHLGDAQPSNDVQGRTRTDDPAASERMQRIDTAHIDRIRQQMKPLPPSQERVAATAQKNPPAIFILSPPRSGSTLLRVMLGGHPGLFAPPELELLAYDTLAEKKVALGDNYSFWSEGIIRAIMALKGCDAEEAKRTMEDWESGQLTTTQCYRLMQTWMGNRTLVDKTPSYSLNLETLKRAEAVFDQARYVHLLRHPQAMIRSFEEAKLDQIFFGHEHSLSVPELAESIWLVSHQNILEFLKGVPAHRRYRLKFEELVKQPRLAVEELCQFLGLAFHPDMLRPYGDQKTRMTDGQAFHPNMLQPHQGQQTRTTESTHPGSTMVGDPKFHQHQGIDAKVADRWREDTTGGFLGDVTWQLAKSLGYERPAQPSRKFGGSGGGLTLQESAQARADKGIPALPRHLESGQPAAFPLLSTQRLMWLNEQPPSRVYNGAPQTMRLRGPLDVGALEASLHEICARHEALRTTFGTQEDGEPVQIVGPPRPVSLTRVDLRELPPEAREAEVSRLLAREAQRPFDLSRDLMLRSALLRLDDEEHVLLLVMHHIVSDGWSVDVLISELSALYNALRSGRQASLPELPVQYADYVVWQQHRLEDGELQRLMDYWKNQLADAPVALHMPSGSPRLWLLRTSKDTQRTLRTPAWLLQELHALCRRQNVTLFMALLAAWATLLHRYSGEEDILIGTFAANRNRPEVENLIGYFANLLIVRHALGGDPSFTELLKRVRKTTVDAFAHSELPVEKLLNELYIDCQVTFTLQTTARSSLKLDGLQVERIEIGSGRSTPFLKLIMMEDDDSLRARLEYNSYLFEVATIDRMLGDFQGLLEDIVADPEQCISRLTLLTEAERGAAAAEAQRRGLPAHPAQARSWAIRFRKQLRRSLRQARRAAGRFLRAGQAWPLVESLLVRTEKVLGRLLPPR